MCCLRMPLEANSWTAVSQRQCIGSEPYSQTVGRTESVVEVVTYLAVVRVVKYANAASQVWLEGHLGSQVAQCVLFRAFFEQVLELLFLWVSTQFLHRGMRVGDE